MQTLLSVKNNRVCVQSPVQVSWMLLAVINPTMFEVSKTCFWQYVEAKNVARGRQVVGTVRHKNQGISDCAEHPSRSQIYTNTKSRYLLYSFLTSQSYPNIPFVNIHK